MGTLIISWLLTAVVCGCFTSAVAASKDHDSIAWLIGGLVFGPLALLASVGLSDQKLRKYIRRIAEHQGAWDSRVMD